MSARRIDIEKFCPSCAGKFAADNDLTHCPQDGELLLPVKHDPLIGKVVAGKYEILEFVGAGGWSQVYRAQDIKLGRPVAFKILRAELASTQEKMNRFKREARIISSLSHPNICLVYDYGIIENGQPYLVLEYLVGKTVEQRLAERCTETVPDTVKLLKQAANALNAAHSQGIIHRDLKPGNLMILDQDGELLVKIIDFGLARTFESFEQEMLTHTGLTIGTPKYMSPEQVRGGVLDARTDIYSFGCVLYEMLIGRSPINGNNTFEIMQNHLEVVPVMEDPDGKIPQALKDLTLNCLIKDATERYVSMREVESDLLSFEKTGKIKRHKKSWTGLFTRRKRKIAAGVVAACLMLTCIAVGKSMAPHTVPGSGAGSAGQSAFDIQLLELKKAAQSDHPNEVAQVADRLVSQLNSQGQARAPQMVAVATTATKYFRESNEPERALPYVKLALTAQQATLPNDGEEYLHAYRDGVAALVDCKEPKIEPYLIQLLLLTEAKYGKDSKEACQALESLVSYTVNLNFPLSKERLTRLLVLQEKYYNQHDYAYLHSLQRMTWVCTNLGQFEKARTYAEKDLSLMSDKLPARFRKDVLCDAALAEKKCHHYDKAVQYFKEAKTVAQSVDTPDADKIGGDLGRCLLEAKNYKEAEPILRDSVKRLETTWGTESATYRLCLSDYVDLLRKTSREKEASAIEAAGKIR